MSNISSPLLATASQSKLILRRATILDVDRLAAIEMKSFYNGGGRARFLAIQVANLTEAVNCPEQMVLVVELDDLVISYAIWERWGAANGYWGDQKTRYPLELEHRRHSFDTSHNPAPSPLPRAAQWRSHSDACHSTITQHFTGAHIECYYLHRLVTHGDFEGRGAGSMLVQWGVDRAKREGVVYGCESTTLGYGFYKRFGMREVSGVDGWIMRSALEEVAAPAVVPEGEDAIPVVQADNGEVPVGSVPGTKVAPSAPPEVSIPVAVPSLSVAKLTGLPLDVLVPEPPLDGLRAALQSVSIAS